MSDPIEFLKARWTEEQQVAEAAIPRNGTGRWQVDNESCYVYGADDGDWADDEIMIHDEGGHDADQARHIAYWDPARVLADLAAKRAIFDLEENSHNCSSRCDTLLWFLHPYLERPDFDPAWR